MNKKVIWFLVVISFFTIFLSSCKKESYTITFDTNGGSNVENQIVEEGKFVTKPVDPIKDGYNFSGWYVSNEFIDSNIYSFVKKVNQNITLYAKWNPLVYQIKYDTDGGEFTDYVPTSFETDEFISLPTPKKEGYRFVGWMEDEAFVETITNKNYNLKAVWEKTVFEVKFVVEGKTYSSTNVMLNTSTQMPSNPAKTGHNFLGWYLNDELFDFSTLISKDLTLEAKFKPVQYKVALFINFDETIEPIMVDYNQTVTLPTPTKEGYKFVCWLLDERPFDENTPITKNIKLFATWEMETEALNEYLSTLVPDTITDKLQFISGIDYCSATFIWKSSDQDVISNTGQVTRHNEDKNVTITVTVLYSDNQYDLKFNTTVLKSNLKPIIKGKIVSGYCYGNLNSVTDKMLEQLDIINYSFASIINGELFVPASISASDVTRCHEKGVRVVLAVGGWGAGGFSEAMRTAEARTKLVNSVMKALKDYQFDGLDIDWEYPTSSVAGITSNPADKNNLTLFCQALKEEMISYRTDLLLTIATNDSNSFYDFKNLNNYIDIFNLMTYDFAMGTTAYHDSALYTVAGASTYSLSQSVNNVKKYVDIDKIVPGAAFYARYGVFKTGTTPNLGLTFGNNANMAKALYYSKLKTEYMSKSNFTEYYDESAEAAYAILGQTFYSYDNERSILVKTAYIKSLGLGGLMCWDLSQDYVDENGFGELLNAMYEGLKK